jgi:hypothetical protein
VSGTVAAGAATGAVKTGVTRYGGTVKAGSRGRMAFGMLLPRQGDSYSIG